MRIKGLRLLMLFCISIAAVLAADAEEGKFTAKAVAEYAHRQTSEKVTIAAQTFETDEQTREAFGKVNPFRFGVLPVLVLVRNEGTDTLRLDRMRVTYILPDHSRANATPAGELRFLRGPSQPKAISGPGGKVAISRSPKNPLGGWAIEGRAFAARVLAPGESASGFFYFQVQQSSAAASVYISGLENARTGAELYYFEIPMSGN